VSFAQRALPPSDWISLRCSRTVRSFLSIFITAGRECRKYTGINRSISREYMKSDIPDSLYPCVNITLSVALY
jgi:hypothetical protein